MLTRLKTINIFKKFKITIQPSNKPIPPVPEAVWNDPWYFFAFGFGSGAIPFAPGTFGTLMAIPFYLLLRPLPLWAYVLFLILFTIMSSWACERVSREIHEHDHPGMCIDEFAGFFVTMLGAPPYWYWIVPGFILFRLFDIWKPWPIRWFDDNIHGGFGMVLDDIVAGIFALIIMLIIRML